MATAASCSRMPPQAQHPAPRTSLNISALDFSTVLLPRVSRSHSQRRRSTPVRTCRCKAGVRGMPANVRAPVPPAAVLVSAAGVKHDTVPCPVLECAGRERPGRDGNAGRRAQDVEQQGPTTDGTTAAHLCALVLAALQLLQHHLLRGGVHQTSGLHLGLQLDGLQAGGTGSGRAVPRRLRRLPGSQACQRAAADVNSGCLGSCRQRWHCTRAAATHAGWPAYVAPAPPGQRQLPGRREESGCNSPALVVQGHTGRTDCPPSSNCRRCRCVPGRPRQRPPRPPAPVGAACVAPAPAAHRAAAPRQLSACRGGPQRGRRLLLLQTGGSDSVASSCGPTQACRWGRGGGRGWCALRWHWLHSCTAPCSPDGRLAPSQLSTRRSSPQTRPAPPS